MASAARDVCAPPPICDLVWKEASPITAVLYYLACLLMGQGTRLILLYGAYGFKNFADWAASPNYRQHLLIFRRTVMAAASFVWRHHYLSIVVQWPFPLAMLVDVRVPWRHRFNLGRLFVTIDLDHLDLYFGQRLRSRVGSVFELFSQKWQLGLLSWARSIRGTVCKVAWR